MYICFATLEEKSWLQTAARKLINCVCVKGVERGRTETMLQKESANTTARTIIARDSTKASSC